MESRMDRYNANHETIKTRTQKNSLLYNDVKNSMLNDFDINSNISVITDETDDFIDVSNVKRYLDTRYSNNAPKRKSIEMPRNDEIVEDEKVLEDTKEYDINAIIEKAKQGKNVDYTKERLRMVRETQYEILNNLNLDEKKVDENPSRKQEEENLMNLINTITQLELCNKNSEKEYTKKEIEANLDLLSDLSDKTGSNETLDVTRTREIDPSSRTSEIKYQNDFTDISYMDKSTLIIKIIIFIVVIVLIFGALYIVNNILDLGLFNWI